MNGKSFGINDLARALSVYNGGTIKDRKAQVSEVFSILRQTILENMDDGDRIMIDDFGIFKCKHRSGRRIENCGLTGKTVDVPERFTLTFKPSSSLQKDMNA